MLYENLEKNQQPNSMELNA